jgi:hypothetical protein
MSDLVCTNLAIWNALAVTDPSAVPPLLVLSKLDLPISVSNNIRKTLRKAREEFATVAESRDAILQKYAKRDETGAFVTFDEGRQTALADPEAFLAELDVLMAIPVTLADVHPTTIAQLGDAKISAETLTLLEAFIVDG